MKKQRKSLEFSSLFKRRYYAYQYSAVDNSILDLFCTNVPWGGIV